MEVVEVDEVRLVGAELSHGTTLLLDLSQLALDR